MNDNIPFDPHGDDVSGYVGKGSELSGTLVAPGPFHIGGRFVGEIHSDDIVSVAGEMEGTILARTVAVRGGSVSGTIDADEVEIAEGARVVGGKVKAARLSLDAGSNAHGTRFVIAHGYQRTPPRRPGGGGG